MSATMNGRSRKSLAEQIDRLDTLLDGLAENLNDGLEHGWRAAGLPHGAGNLVKAGLENRSGWPTPHICQDESRRWLLECEGAFPVDLSQIEDGLFQGGMTDVEPPPGIDVVVNVRRTPNNFLASVGLTALLHFPLVDHAFPGVAWLDMVVDCLAACRRRGQRVLVHCASGQSRSSLVVIGKRLTHGPSGARRPTGAVGAATRATWMRELEDTHSP